MNYYEKGYRGEYVNMDNLESRQQMWAKAEYDNGRSAAIRDMYSDNGESFAKGVHGFFGMIYEFIKAPLFGKLIWLMGFGVILNGCAVGLVTFQQGETYGLQRFGILLVIGSVLIYFLRKHRFRTSIFSVLVVALFYWSYRIVADDIAKKESIANQR